jgi:hypothetical protein
MSLRIAFSLLVTLLLSSVSAAQAAAKHPNLLLNPDEIEQIRAKIKQHEWAARLFERVQALANDGGRTGRNPREAALVYALTGDKKYGDAVRRALVSHSRHLLTQYETLDVRTNPDFGAWGPLATLAWAYDLTYDLYSPEERTVIERYLRTAARTLIGGLKIRSTSPDLVFGKHVDVGIIGFCLGDRELIDWGLNDPGHHGPAFGGFYQVLDTNIRDRYFWGEAPRYALGHTLQGMLALAEAALHYDGTDLYHHVAPKSGGSIKGLLDGYLRLLYPLERTGIAGGSLRMITFGDASTAISPRGEMLDTFLINPVVGGPKFPLSLNGELEVAYKRYRDPGYAWVLHLSPKRDTYTDISPAGGSGKVWGYAALTHGEPLPDNPEPPAALSGVYPGQGLAVLHSDDSPRYWTSGALTAAVRLGSAVGHGHPDYFHLILHGGGRLLYPDLQIITYEPTFLNWGREGIGHNTLLVDHQSPKPGPFTTRQAFRPEFKFFAVTGSAFENVTQTRALALTPEYLVDVFHARDKQDQARTFDWVMHGFGRLYPGNPAAYRPSDALVPYYWWIDNERSRRTDATWQVDWVQKSAGALPGAQPLGKEWFGQTAGVRLTMLGERGTEVFHGDGPITDSPPYHRLEGNPEGSLPLVVARRQAAATTFVAVHEPYAKQTTLRTIRRISERAGSIGLELESETFSDLVLIALEPGQWHTLRWWWGNEVTFKDHAHIRITPTKVTVHGSVSGMRVEGRGLTNRVQLVVNGYPQPARWDSGLVFGEVGPLPQGGMAGGAGKNPADTEKQAALHYHFLPDEVHLSAGGAKVTTLHLRCTGQGELKGRLTLRAPAGLTVEPDAIDVTGMREGDEKTVRVKVRAAADAASTLHTIRIEPDKPGLAAAGTLLVSVGVVMTPEKRLPLLAQTVIRAPGYTMKLDHLSGVSYYLLDADGNRRHGHIHDASFAYGFGAVEAENHWAFKYHQPIRFVFEGRNRIAMVSGGDAPQVRLRYTFHEDRIVVGLVPPTNPTQSFNLWFGNFDVLGKPRYEGTTEQRGKVTALVGDWFFFPHPVHRQGLLVLLPEKAPLSPMGTAFHVPARTGQEVVLRFATPEELPALLRDRRY